VSTSVYRDPYGIPHLRADSVDELAALQGSNAAWDRAWQIELARLRAVGEVSGALGADWLDWDVFARRARLADTAGRCFARLDERTRRWLEAYVAGVNGRLEEGAQRAPEFAAIGIRPGQWAPWAPIAVFLAQHLLFANFPDKLWQAHVRDTLGPEVMAWFLTDNPHATGSNAYGLVGRLTATGLPLIAGDPHRYLDLPGVYQQVRLACPEFDVVGLAFPGVPGVPHFGHAGSVAWAITNAMADYQDLFREDLRRDRDGVWAREADGWSRCKVRIEQIPVSHDAVVNLEAIETLRGPVIIGGPGEPAYSLRTPTRVEADAGFRTLLPLLHAKTAADVTAAFEHWVEPVNAVIPADDSGSVLRRLAGRVPLRPIENMQVPAPAWEPKWAWSGGYAAMPISEVEDVVVNANDRTTGAGLGVDYARPYRATRITALLTASSGIRVADLARIHTDDHLEPARLAQRLIEAVEVGGAAGRIRDRLLGWDRRMAAGSQEALVFAAWRSELVHWLARQQPLSALADVPSAPDLFDRWLEPVTRLGYVWETACERASELGIDITSGVRIALERVAARPPTGSWGDHHTLAALYEPSGHPDVAEPDLGAVGVGGDKDCVLATTSIPGVTDRFSVGPTARYIWDLANRQQSRWVVPFGASGVPGEPHFADQLPLWAAGELIPVITDWDRLTPETG
jgi:penicillin amidase